MDLVSLLTNSGGVVDTSWNVSKAYYDAGTDAWNISKAFNTDNALDVSAQELNPNGVVFKPDGTKVYVSGSNGDDITEYNLSSAWNLLSASYVQDFSVGSQDSSPQGLFFKPDGTKMYVVGSTNDAIYEYTLSSAWDISTASYIQNFSVSTEEVSPTGLFFKPDGTKMYICGSTGDDVNEYSLSTPWDVSSASYVQNFSVATQDNSPRDLFFKPDGTKMYIVGAAGTDINEYTLSSAWDISTASYVHSFSLTQGTFPGGMFFTPSGSAFYVVYEPTRVIYQYPIGGFSVAAQETNPTDLFFKPDGTKLYVLGATGDDVNEYNLSTAWDILSASYVQNFSVSSQETNPLGMFFKPDGTKMYVVGSDNNNVNEYSLSSAWDISTASYSQNFSVSAQGAFPFGMFFKPDGTKMYVVGSSDLEVNEYSLSSAWNISTASYVQNFSVSAQGTSARGLFFKPDGTKMYVTTGTASDRNVSEYSLSSAWDISTANHVQNFSVIAQTLGNSRGIFWKDDGTQFFVISSSNDKILSYLISPE